MKKRVLLSGGTGFVGYWMCKTQPVTITAKYLDHRLYDWDDWRDHHWDYWDYYVHLAPIKPTALLQHARTSKVLFASSGAVYEGVNAYANNKRLWEAECINSSYSYVVIARLFAFVGEHLKNLYAVTKFIEAARKGKPIEVWGDGTTVRSYLYGEDLGRWMWKILLDGEGTYDVGSAIPYTILDLACIVSELTGAPLKFISSEQPSVYLPDITRAYDLGCRETVGLREAIERMLNEGI